MKTNLKSLTHLILAGALVTTLAACNTVASEVIVVTATSTNVAITAPGQPVTLVTPQPTVVELTLKPDTAPRPAALAAGVLLKGSGDGVFYLTAAGTRLHLNNMDTLRAFGFEEKDIVATADSTLAELPLAGELTRLVFDAQDNLFWVADGRLWPVNEWKKVVERVDYTGLPVTRLDPSLQANLSRQNGFSEDTLLRADGTFYFFDHGVLIALKSKPTHEMVVDIPAEMAAAYQQEMQLAQTRLQLRGDIPAANVRQSPDLQAEILGTVKSGDRLIGQARSVDHAWLQIFYQGQPGWLAANLVEESVAVSLLPAVYATPSPTTTPVPQAQPAAIVETSTPQPLICTDVPIRGFGLVWSKYGEVRTTIGCPDAWQGGEQATQAAVQRFQNGVMLWLAADGVYDGDDPIYVFVMDGSFQRFSDLGPADPAKVGSVPPGFVTVDERFSKVYWEGTGAQVKERLGYALEPAQESAGAQQQFSNGRMFWVEALDRIFVIYEYSYFDGQNNWIPVRAWHSYEDTF